MLGEQRGDDPDRIFTDRPRAIAAVVRGIRGRISALRQAGLIHQYYTGTSRLDVLRRRDLDTAFLGFLDSVISAAAETSTSAR